MSEAELPEAWQPEELPDNIGDCIDLAYTLRAERLEKEKEIAVMRKREEDLRNHIFNSFDMANIEGARGKIATASVTEELKPEPKDWDQIWAYIVENSAFELMEKRIARVAYRELFEAGVLVPGTEAFMHKKLSLVKSTRSRKGE
jgi:hypothetical protein